MASRKRRRRRSNKHALNAVYAVFVAAVLVVTVVLLHGRGGTPAPSVAHATTQQAADAAAADFVTAPRAGLTLSSWAGVTPSPTALSGTGAPQWVIDGCLNVTTAADASRCVYGDKGSSKLLALVGDETAISYLPALLKALPNWRIQVLTYSQCPFVDVPVVPYGREHADPACAAQRDFVKTDLTALKPTMIVSSGHDDELVHRIDGGANDDPDLVANLATWKAGLHADLTFLTSVSSKVALVESPPAGPDLTACGAPAKTPGSCRSILGPRYQQMENLEDAEAAADGVRYINAQSWFCYSGACPAVVSGHVVEWDHAHLTAAMSQSLSQNFQRTLPF